MSDFTIYIDGVEIAARPGQTVIEAADEAGVYIPRLCHLPGLPPHGSCRMCTVIANGRPASACYQPVVPGMVVENDTDELLEHRKALIEMLFVEGNHFCMFCEKSGNCELQALAYRFGVTAPRFPYHWFPSGRWTRRTPTSCRPEPLHPVRPLRAGLAGPGRQAGLPVHAPRTAQEARPSTRRPGSRTRISTSRTRRWTSARWAR